MAGISLVQSVPKNTRVTRRPQHTFQVRHVPFAIQPFLIAPVLPGETMENMLLQSRVVSDPIKNPLTGWWLEYYFFYVKHRDLTQAASSGGQTVAKELEEMVLDPSWSPTDIDSPTQVFANYFAGNGIDWVQHCLERVVEEYFRNEGEAWNAFTVTPVGGTAQPIASITGNGWMDSLILRSAMAPAEDLVINPAASDLLASEIDRGMRNYEMLKMTGLVEMSYEDYLTTYGVSVGKPEDPHRPELIRYLRDWTYPTNTVDPANGTPRSALSWSIAERADKNRFFREPGFIFGVTCCRPKTYYRNQIGAGVWYLKSLQTWLPAVMEDDPMTSVIQVGGSAVSPVDIANADYMLDVRDLFIYGDQFINFDPAATDANMVPLPTATTLHRYITAIADIDEFFVTAGTNRIRHDGVVTLSIKGRQRDRTPTELSKT